MKIDETILSIPPYISTSWKNVLSLTMEDSVLVVNLVGGTSIRIPDLENTTIHKIFEAHLRSLKTKKAEPNVKDASSLLTGFSFPFKLGGGGGLDNLGMTMQHNPEQAHMPNLPEDILKKIASVAKMVGIHELEALPKAEPHCNCPYCQIVRALHPGDQKEETIMEEEVTEEDLKFRSWEIQQRGEDLYEVINPLDIQEHYQVYLGKPIGCTCGHRNCEHIKAVLYS